MRAGAIVALIVLSGCAGTPLSIYSTGSVEPALPAQWHVEAEGCLTTVTFFLVEKSQAHPFLPPGFHAGDLSQFLYDTPATAGKVPAFVAASTCDRFNVTDPATFEQHAGALEVVYVGFFIRPPQFVAAYANQPAAFNFYAVTFLTPLSSASPEVLVPSDTVAMYGWNQTDASLTLAVENVTREAPTGHPLLTDLAKNGTIPDRIDVLTSTGRVTQDGEDIFTFSAEAFFPQPFEDAPRLRFWQAAPEGIGFMQFDLPRKTVMAGPLDECQMTPGSIVHRVAGDRAGTHEGRPCGLTESFALIFDDHSLSGALHHMQDVHPV